MSNLVPFALLDVAALAASGGLGRHGRAHPRVRAGRPARWRRSRCGSLSSRPSSIWCFSPLWGLNYRRVPLERKLDFDPALVTREAARTLGGEAVRLVNASVCGRPCRAAAAGLASATVRGRSAPPRRDATRACLDVPEALACSACYFRWAAIDGMTDPFFLEVIVNPDVLPIERPFVLAHEWAHLAGYADESEANFVAWLTCARGDARRALLRMARALRASERRPAARGPPGAGGTSRPRRAPGSDRDQRPPPAAPRRWSAVPRRTSTTPI